MARTRADVARAEAIRAAQAPHEHVPRLVTSKDVIGSMWLFVGITTGIVVWLFAGNIIGFDRTPWPLLLTVLNLPQLSIMISLQVSANRAQAASDARAMADHATLVALHELSKRQVNLLHGQNEVLAGQNQVLDVLRTAVAGGGKGSAA